MQKSADDYKQVCDVFDMHKAEGIAGVVNLVRVVCVVFFWGVEGCVGVVVL